MSTSNTLQAWIGGSPSEVYIFFILSLCKEYFTSISELNKPQLDARTAALVAFVPNDNVRQNIWAQYTKMKDDYPNATLSASVHAVGAVVSYLNESLEFTKESTGAYI